MQSCGYRHFQACCAVQHRSWLWDILSDQHWMPEKHVHLHLPVTVWLMNAGKPSSVSWHAHET